MLPELILREERLDDWRWLFLLSLVSGLFGFITSMLVFPAQIPIVSVVFASIPLVYPFTSYFLDEEDSEMDFVEDATIYGVIFVGQVTAFFLAATFFSPENFSSQINTFVCTLYDNMGIQMIGGESLASIVGETKCATGVIGGRATWAGFFLNVLSNNLLVFTVILFISALIGSAGAFILVWNASVLGVFMATIVRKLPGKALLTGTENIPSPIAYLPHTFFEITGFILAGISGTMISAAIYRKHHDTETWKNIVKMVLLGLICILTGAILETA